MKFLLCIVIFLFPLSSIANEEKVIDKNKTSQGYNDELKTLSHKFEEFKKNNTHQKEEIKSITNKIHDINVKIKELNINQLHIQKMIDKKQDILFAIILFSLSIVATILFPIILHIRDKKIIESSVEKLKKDIHNNTEKVDKNINDIHLFRNDINQYLRQIPVNLDLN